MSQKTELTLELLKRKFHLRCSPEEIDLLKQAASYLDTKMQEIESAGSSVGFEKTAVLAAINVSYELMIQRANQSTDNQEVFTRLQALQKKMSDTLSKSNIELNARTAGAQQTLDI